MSSGQATENRRSSYRLFLPRLANGTVLKTKCLDTLLVRAMPQESITF